MMMALDIAWRTKRKVNSLLFGFEEAKQSKTNGPTATSVVVDVNVVGRKKCLSSQSE